MLGQTRLNILPTWSALVNTRYGDASFSKKWTLLIGRSFPRCISFVSPVSKLTTCSLIAQMLGKALNLSAKVCTKLFCLVQTAFFFIDRKKISPLPENKNLPRKNQRRLCFASMQDVNTLLQVIELSISSKFDKSLVLCDSRTLTRAENVVVLCDSMSNHSCLSPS